MYAPQICSPMTARLPDRDMPPDKQPRIIKNGRPTTVPAGHLRTKNAPYMSPRLVGTSPPKSSPTESRKDAFETEIQPRGSSRSGIATPVKTFLNSNITPRSGSRKTRVDSASSTPNRTPRGTPTGSRPTSIISSNERDAESIRPFNGYHTQELDGQRRMRTGSMSSNGKSSNISAKEPSVRQLGNGWHDTGPKTKPMFFHASDIKKSPPQNQSHFPHIQTKLDGNSHTIIQQELDMDASSSSAASPPESMLPKFFHANGRPEFDSPTTKSDIGSSSPASSILSPRQTTFSTSMTSPLQKPISPPKEMGVSRNSSLSKASPRVHKTLLIKEVQKTTQSDKDTAASGNTHPNRRVSLKAATVPQIRHAKANSVSSISSQFTEPPANRRSSLALSVNRPASPATPEKKPESVVNALPKQLTSVYDLAPPVISSSPPQSPVLMLQSPNRSTPAESKVDQMNALAANARRERKVLDLEISNSSLLAINRTLEREMRKQTTELRRYRRLTSAGRISIAPSGRSLSGRFSTSNTTESDEMSDFEDDLGRVDNELDLSSSDESSTSAGSGITSSRQREKDARRLQLDLSRHQELLIDSQRINQSLKRCLGWTESLISEGRKALAYHIHISDLEAGGRVLAEEETEGDVPGRKGLLSPGLEKRDPEDLWIEGEPNHETSVNVNATASFTEPFDKDDWDLRIREVGKLVPDLPVEGTSDVEEVKTPPAETYTGLGIEGYLSSLVGSLGM